jgi:hypothetical protein
MGGPLVAHSYYMPPVTLMILAGVRGGGGGGGHTARVAGRGSCRGHSGPYLRLLLCRCAGSNGSRCGCHG